MHVLPDLPPAIAREVLATLCAALPPPIVNTPEARAARDDGAMAALAVLQPADAFEARLAAQIVAADAHAMDSLRLAGEASQDAGEIRRCRSQAGMMLRHVQSGLRALQRMQATREKAQAEMHPVAMERAGYWFRDASPPAPAPTQGPETQTPRTQAPQPDPAVQPEPDAPEDRFSTLTEAEQYAVIYPDRAARIRASGGLPANLDFAPVNPAIAAALVNGTSPILRALDHSEHITVTV